MTRVFIVAASPLARTGLANLLVAQSMEVVGSAASVDALAAQLSEVAPDVVLIDSSGGPFEVLLDSVVSAGLASDLAVVFLMDATTRESAIDAIRAGARAALPADIFPDQLALALKAAAGGLIVLHPSQIPAEFSQAVPTTSSASHILDELVEPLTPREREVLQMLAGGLGNKEIATRLGVSEHTIKFHVGSILGKFGASSRTEAVSIGIRRGLVLL